jgi:hypothetical protein
VNPDVIQQSGTQTKENSIKRIVHISRPFFLALIFLTYFCVAPANAQQDEPIPTGIFVLEDDTLFIVNTAFPLDSSRKLLAVSVPELGNVEIDAIGELNFQPLDLNTEFDDQFTILTLHETDGIQAIVVNYGISLGQFSLAFTTSYSGLTFIQDFDSKEVAKRIFDHFDGDPKKIVEEIVKLDNVGGGRDKSIPRNGHEIATATELFELLAQQEILTLAERHQLAEEIEDLKGFRNRLRALENGQRAGAAGGAVVATVLIDALTRRAAFRRAKRDAGIPTAKNPDEVRRVPMTDKNGKPILGDDKKPIITREYVFKSKDGKEIVIQDHGAGHSFGAPGGKGDQTPHFNVRPGENTRTGKVPGTDAHYPFDDNKSP